ILTQLVPKKTADTALGYSDPCERTGYLRATAIGALVAQCAEVFAARAPALLDGQSVGALVRLCPAASAVRELEDLARDRCYQNPHVLEREAAGYNAIHEIGRAAWRGKTKINTDATSVKRREKWHGERE